MANGWLTLSFIAAINFIIVQNILALHVLGEANFSTANNTYLNNTTTTSSLSETSLPNVAEAAWRTNLTEKREKIPLYIGGIFSMGGDWDSGGILPAVEMGLDHVNDRVDVLPQYELKMVWNDSQVCVVLFYFFLLYML